MASPDKLYIFASCNISLKCFGSELLCRSCMNNSFSTELLKLNAVVGRYSELSLLVLIFLLSLFWVYLWRMN